MVQVPQLDFVNLDFTADLPSGGSTGENYTEYCYQGPSRIVQRVATAVSAQGQVLPITAPGTNATWTVDFWGPSLQCNPVEGKAQHDVWANVWDFMKNTTRCQVSYGYMAWTPTANSSLPFVNTSHDGMVLQNSEIRSGSPATILVATIPQMFLGSVSMASHVLPGGCAMATEAENFSYYDQPPKCESGCIPSPQTWFSDATLLRCDLLNTSHTATFEYVNGLQTINVSMKESSPPGPLTLLDCVTGPILAYQQSDNTNKTYYEPICSTLNTIDQQCIFDPAVAQLLSYQSIADSFGNLVLGTIGLGTGSTPNSRYDCKLFYHANDFDGYCRPQFPPDLA